MKQILLLGENKVFSSVKEAVEYSGFSRTTFYQHLNNRREMPNLNGKVYVEFEEEEGNESDILELDNTIETLNSYKKETLDALKFLDKAIYLVLEEINSKKDIDLVRGINDLFKTRKNLSNYDENLNIELSGLKRLKKELNNA